MEPKAIQTKDREAALGLLGQCLDSGKVLYACIRNLDGVYAIEVSEPTNCRGELLNPELGDDRV